MIKVTFTDGQSRSYSIGCKQLGFLSWHHMDYRSMFAPIAAIINEDVNDIESWRVHVMKSRLTIKITEGVTKNDIRKDWIKN